MSALESVKRLGRRWLVSLPFFVLLGLILGGLIAVAVIPQPKIGIITLSGPILDQNYTDDILDRIRTAREDTSIRAVVLRIDSPGGGASATEQIYLDVLRLRQRKPVVVSIGTIAASGGYYVAVASNFIYAEPTSQLGSIGVWSGLPQPEKLEEDLITSGPFKATGRSWRKAVEHLEMVRQEFVAAVMSQRGDRLKLSETELSRAEIYLGLEGFRNGLIDEIGTRTDAMEKAASLAGIRNYAVVELSTGQLPLWLFFFNIEELKSRANLVPAYYYLYFESE